MISGFDHLAITCVDVDASIAFYERVLGAEQVFPNEWAAGSIPVAILRVGANALSLHRASAPADPKAAHPTPGAVDLCFRWEGPIDAAIVHLESQGVEVIVGPVPRIASDSSRAVSVYFRDLDGNLLEFLTVTA